MPRLVLINGAPGSGKSTLAHHLADEDPSAVAIDLDTLKHSLEDWEADPMSAGLQARQRFLLRAHIHLLGGGNVYLGQFLGKVDFIEELESLAVATDSTFVELMLLLPEPTLAQRLAGRHRQPTRPEHYVNNGLASPADAADFVAAVDTVLRLRPDATTVDASGTMAQTLAAIRGLLEP